MKLDFLEMIKNIGALKEQIAKVKSELANKTVESSVGAGLVKVTMNGNHEVVSLVIEKELIDSKDAKMIQDLTIAAVNDAYNKSKELTAQEFSKIAFGMNIPGIKDLL